MQTKKHIQQVRNTYAANKQIILARTSLKETDYLELKFETAMQFLERLFPNYKVLVQRHSQSKLFWSWWHSEWCIWEDQMIYSHIYIDANEYYIEIEHMAHCGSVEQSFRHNYLKQTKAK